MCVLMWVVFLWDEVKGKYELLWKFLEAIDLLCDCNHLAKWPPLGHLAAVCR